MTYARNYRRPALPARPWISNKLYDTLSRDTVLHCDAYLFLTDNREYLVIDWREGGKVLVAHDAYLIEPDGLTPVWGVAAVRQGALMYWTRENNATMGGMHQRVLANVRETAVRFPKWSRVSLLCHYVHCPDTDCEIRDNRYKGRLPPKPLTMADLHANAPGMGKPRGRPRKPKGNGLPDIL